MESPSSFWWYEVKDDRWFKFITDHHVVAHMAKLLTTFSTNFHAQKIFSVSKTKVTSFRRSQARFFTTSLKHKPEETDTVQKDTMQLLLQIQSCNICSSTGHLSSPPVKVSPNGISKSPSVIMQNSSEDEITNAGHREVENY